MSGMICVDRPRHGLASIHLARGNDDLGALFRHPDRNGTADTTGGARDECYFAGEIE
jgi:hypothetical protein